MQTVSAIEEILRDGFAIYEGIFDSETVEETVRGLEVAFRDSGEIAAAGYRDVTAIPVLAALARSGELRDLASSILGRDAFVVRTLFFDKNPASNWKVAWHQDLTICVRKREDAPGFGSWSVKDGIPHVQPPVEILDRMITLRLHLDDCDETNGALRVLPGSHSSGKLAASSIREWRNSVPEHSCNVLRGGVLAMRPLLLHASSAVVRPSHRRVSHLEFAAEDLPGDLEWHARKGLNATDGI